MYPIIYSIYVVFLFLKINNRSDVCNTIIILGSILMCKLMKPNFENIKFMGLNWGHSMST